MASAVLYDIDTICKYLPHRPPFLFVDRITGLVPDRTITAERDIRPDEFFFKGHFPGNPIMPGALTTDALAQTSGLLWGLSRKDKGVESGTPGLFFLAAADVKFVSPAYPGDTLILVSYFVKQFGKLFSYSVEACAGKKTIAKGSLALAMIGE
jgi:3-hydroxyacyl-[acyl-carrier-protein] dehydratase